MHYSVVQLVGAGTPTDPFRPPTTEEYQIIDLRPLSAQEEGKVDGFALVATPERVKRLGLYLGDDAKAVSPGMARQLSNRLGLNLDADPTLGEIIGELLTRHATAPTDGSRWNPVQGARVVTPQGNRWVFEAYLGGNEPVWTREVLRADGGQQYTDDFNRSNASNLSSPWQPRDGGVLPIVSQKVVPSGTSGDLAVYLAPLNSDDHWSQIDMVSSDSNFRGIDTQVRMQSSSSDLSCYGTGYIIAAGGYEMYKKNSIGNQTNLYSVSRTNPQTATIRTEIRGSTLKGYVSGVVQNTITDTSITSGKYAAIFTYQAQGRLSLDNFIASDFQATFAADATIGSTGLHRKTIRKNNALVGTVSSAGVLTRMKSAFRSFAGSIASSGTLKRAFTRNFASNITPTAPVVTKFPRIGTNLAGTVATTARIKFSPIRRFAGTIASAGTPILKNVGRVFGEAGFAKVWNEVTGEIRSWISKG